MNDSEIVVGLHDSPPAKAALRWAAEQARVTGTRLHAVSVVDCLLACMRMGARSFEPLGLGSMARSGTNIEQ